MEKSKTVLQNQMTVSRSFMGKFVPQLDKTIPILMWQDSNARQVLLKYHRTFINLLCLGTTKEGFS